MNDPHEHREGDPPNDRPGDDAGVPTNAADTAGNPKAPGAGDAEPPPDAALGEWQRLLLPWMTRFLVGSGAVFALLTFVQLALIHVDIRAANDPATSNAIRAQLADYGGAYLLEFTVLERRYHMNNVALLSRTWIKYLGFLTGMLMVFVGAVYIIGKFQEELSTMSLKQGNRSATLSSTSPGLFVSAFGTAVILASIFATTPISSQDRPLLNWLPHAQVGLGAAAEGPDDARAAQQGSVTPRFLERSLEALRTADYEASACDNLVIQRRANAIAAWEEENPLTPEEHQLLDRYRQACEVAR